MPSGRGLDYFEAAGWGGGVFIGSEGIGGEFGTSGLMGLLVGACGSVACVVDVFCRCVDLFRGIGGCIWAS